MGEDYGEFSGDIRLSNEVNFTDVRFDIFDDEIFEEDETIVIAMTRIFSDVGFNDANVTLNPARTTVVIQDNDFALPQGIQQI